MKRFRFPLEKLQRLRGHHEKVARRTLAARLAAVAALESEIETVDENLEVCRAEDRRAHSLGEAMQAGLLTTRRNLETRLVGAKAEAEQARIAYAEARQQLRTIEKLYERRREVWIRELAAEEQAEMDEIARIRFAASDSRGLTR